MKCVKKKYSRSKKDARKGDALLSIRFANLRLQTIERQLDRPLLFRKISQSGDGCSVRTQHCLILSSKLLLFSFCDRINHSRNDAI